MYASVSNLHFEMDQNHTDPTNLLSGRPAITADDFLNYSSDLKVKGKPVDDKVLIQQLQKLGIDVFEFTDMSHNDRHLNIKVRDVIQVYRVFNNLRDSGEDSFDYIKLEKLLYFPFFD